MNIRPLMREWPRNPQIGPPLNPMDTTLRYRAQSILHGMVDDPLPDTAEQAQDVIDWASQGFQPHRQDEAAAARGALADGDFYSEVHRAE